MNSSPNRFQTNSSFLQPSKTAVWCGRVLSALAVLFLGVDATVKLAQLPPAIQASAELGFSAQQVFLLGLVQAVCLVLYVVPRTAILGAILWTGYLGGAIAIHFRAQHSLFSHVLFPVYVALLLWFGLGLRSRHLRAALLGSFQTGRSTIGEDRDSFGRETSARENA